MSLIKPIKIGHITVEDPVILAPMTDVTDKPFRHIVKQHGAGLVISEMIASQAMIRQTRQSMLMIQKSDIESPMAVQLAGCEPEVMAEAAKLNEDMGAEIIDINMGCPMKKVVNNYAGSALMRDEILAGKILAAVVKAVKVPVTLKMRMGWDDHSLNAPKIAKIAEDEGIQMLTIHGRTRCQLYNGNANWPFIRTVKDAVKIPVIGNGDVVTLDNAKQLLEESGADGVMIGRGAYGKPWFIQQVIDFLKTGVRTPDPSAEHQYKVVQEHFAAMIDHYGERSGVLVGRKHMGWYSKGIKNSTEFRLLINQATESKVVKELITRFFEEHLAAS
jgi:tRNA-dihydrouridine synthase B